MKKTSILIIVAVVLALFAVVYLSSGSSKGDGLYTISTKYGDIKIKLYDETPEHKKNFIKLIEKKDFDGTLFHRVIKDFMIQGGDPDSKNAKAGDMLGAGTLGYTIPAEINPKFIMKKGVLAAARQGDEVNPKKESSSSQFFIVTGKVHTPEDLTSFENDLTEYRKDLKKRDAFMAYIQSPEHQAEKEALMELSNQHKEDSLMALQNAILAQLESTIKYDAPYKFSPEQFKAYTAIGGAPGLDGEYTIFGEVVEGMDIVEKIAAVAVDQNNRPVEDIKVSIK